jgi:hypothetical protein
MGAPCDHPGTRSDPGAGDEVTAHVRGDDELGVTVVRITTTDARIDHRLDVIALSLASAFMVEELIQASDREASP